MLVVFLGVENIGVESKIKSMLAKLRDIRHSLCELIKYAN